MTDWRQGRNIAGFCCLHCKPACGGVLDMGHILAWRVTPSTQSMAGATGTTAKHMGVELESQIIDAELELQLYARLAAGYPVALAGSNQATTQPTADAVDVQKSSRQERLPHRMSSARQTAMASDITTDPFAFDDGGQPSMRTGQCRPQMKHRDARTLLADEATALPFVCEG